MYYDTTISTCYYPYIVVVMGWFCRGTMDCHVHFCLSAWAMPCLSDGTGKIIMGPQDESPWSRSEVVSFNVVQCVSIIFMLTDKWLDIIFTNQKDVDMLHRSAWVHRCIVVFPRSPTYKEWPETCTHMPWCWNIYQHLPPKWPSHVGQ